jgi:hypothetical protein
MQGEKHMTKVEEMWTALAAYQPQADAAGHGLSWARMCKEKTAVAAYCAADAAADATAAVADAATAAAVAVAATYAADAATYAAAKKWAQIAIDRITKVLVKPAPVVHPAVPDAITDTSENPEYRAGWNDCRQTMMEMMKARTL